MRERYYENTQKELNTQLLLTTQRMEDYLHTLQNDMRFISRLDIMNDLYTQDLDKRISKLLGTKKKELNLLGDFHIIDKEGKIIASSNQKTLFSKPQFKPLYTIPIYSPIDNTHIATFLLEFSTKNLENFFHNSKTRHYAIIPTSALETKSRTKLLMSAQTLNNAKEFTVILQEDDEAFLSMLQRYEQMFIVTLILGAIVIALVAFYFINRLITPILQLSSLVEDITQTQNYSQSITMKRDDEIGKLAKAFNEMLSGIDKALQENIQLTKEIEETQKEVVFTMGAIGESRSKETGNHVKRVAEYSKVLALHYGLSEEEAEMLKQASPMHDIGKVAIPDAILNKPGRFTPEEFEHMKEHAQLGYEMLHHSTRPLLQTAAIVAYEHHEKWDGSGYPRGLKGDDIHIYGRITAIADVFDALGSDRVYKKAWEDERIFTLFKEERGKHFDPTLVDIFFKHLDTFLAIREKFKDDFEDDSV